VVRGTRLRLLKVLLARLRFGVWGRRWARVWAVKACVCPHSPAHCKLVHTARDCSSCATQRQCSALRLRQRRGARAPHSCSSATPPSRIASHHLTLVHCAPTCLDCLLDCLLREAEWIVASEFLMLQSVLAKRAEINSREFDCVWMRSLWWSKQTGSTKKRSGSGADALQTAYSPTAHHGDAESVWLQPTLCKVVFW